MIPEDLRKKLEALNRGPLTVGARRPSRKTKPDVPVRLEDLVDGEVIGETDRTFYLVSRRLGELFDRADELTREFRSVWLSGRHALSDEDVNGRWRDVIETDPKRLLFLDIETCGLTSTPAFLIGTMHLTDDGFRMRQFFARDYTEERAALTHLAGIVGDFETLITYNGKSFDWPYLNDRAVYHAVTLADVPGHLDLLHEARRRWKHVLPNCQLQTLEYHVAGRRRVGDLPGSLIPEAYHHYVKTGNARQMVDVIHHNALDLITMAELMLFILQGGELVWE